MKKFTLLLTCLMALFIIGCDIKPKADDVDQERQEKLQSEGSAQVGMPDIHNFTEKKMVKMLYELRDSPNLINYAYTYSEVTGKMMFIGKCVGFGIPYSAQFSNPQKEVYSTLTLPQAEPNGLFMPSSSDGTWLMMIDPTSNKPVPVYIEPKVIVSPFRFQQ